MPESVPELSYMAAPHPIHYPSNGYKQELGINADDRTYSIDSREAAVPGGWKYKSIKLGPIVLPWYASPEIQLLLVSLVCFLCPGMFNALNGLGGGGQVETNATSAANAALYATFSVVGFFAGTIVNTLGIRVALSFGGLGYSVYVSALLAWSEKVKSYAYIIIAGVFLGCCAGILWCAQGAIMMSYPTEKAKGKFISRFWIIFNLGGVIGSLVALATNFKASGQGTEETQISAANTGTYVGILVLTILGAVLSWTLVDAKDVVRKDFSKIIAMKQPTWKTEIIGLWETLRTDPYIILLFPMFFASNWFYTYQFNGVNHALFNVRTRALNSAIYWLAQMFGAWIFGMALDYPNIRRTTRAKIAWVVMFVLTFAVWGGGYASQRRYTREDTKKPDWTVFDWTSPRFGGYMVLYICYGFYDAAWQTCVYWFMGAISNNSRKLANLAGFYKGIQSAGAAIVWRLDGLGTSYNALFQSCWVLLACSLVIALPVMLVKIQDTVPIEEDLKFTDETIEDVLSADQRYELLYHRR